MPAAAASPAAPDSLPELLRIMDVATALRQEREKAAVQLDLEQTKAALRQRLRATADTMGETVSDAEIEAAINRYFGQLHEFKEPPPGLARTLAHLWVRRGLVLGVAAALAVLTFGGWWLFASPSSPWSPAAKQARLAAQRSELAARTQRYVDETFAKFTNLHATVLGLAREPAATDEANALKREAEAARASGQGAAVEQARVKLDALRADLDEEYELRIVSRPGENSGIDAYTDAARTKVSGYYLIVEAVTPAGKVLPRRVRDAEKNQSVQVRKWGEQVPKGVYDRIAADKRADGIVDDNVFARKRRGYRDLEVVLPATPGGAPLRRGRQITSDLD
jgi:hypothetical protein